MSGQPTVIYSAASTQQAYLHQGLLEEQGIAARVVNDAIQLAGGDLPLGWAAAARVVVDQPDALRARQLAEEFDRQTAHEPTDDDPPSGEIVEWTDWPVCPDCGERRSARCPVCGASGTSFPLADIQESVAGQRVFLLCGACDDHMLPEWYRLCPRCGHDFGDGVEMNRSSQPVIEISRSEWLVAALTVLGGLALAAYFIWLFNRRSGLG
jgi:putative signal transducing protein